MDILPGDKPGTTERDAPVTVVVGAGGDIGKATARRLSQDGFSIVVADLDQEKSDATVALIHQQGGSAVGIVADVTQPASIDAMCNQALHAFSRIDALVYSAGVLRRSPAATVTYAEWVEVISVNLTGAFLCAQAVYHPMKQRGAGRIVNIGSIAATSTSLLGGPHYTASKAALVGLTRHLAREWGPDRITVNHVSPGYIDTAMTRDAVSAAETEAIAKRIPIGRLGSPDDVAGVVSMLLREDMAYVTGADLAVHGGLAL